MTSLNFTDFCKISVPGSKPRIRIGRNKALIDAGLADAVLPLLAYRGPGGSLQRVLSDAFFTWDRKGNIETFAGLVPRVQRHLVESGVDFAIDEGPAWKPSRLLDHDFPGRVQLSARQQRALATIVQKPQR